MVMLSAAAYLHDVSSTSSYLFLYEDNWMDDENDEVQINETVNRHNSSVIQYLYNNVLKR